MVWDSWRNERVPTIILRHNQGRQNKRVCVFEGGQESEGFELVIFVQCCSLCLILQLYAIRLSSKRYWFWNSISQGINKENLNVSNFSTTCRCFNNMLIKKVAMSSACGHLYCLMTCSYEINDCSEACNIGLDSGQKNPTIYDCY